MILFCMICICYNYAYKALQCSLQTRTRQSDLGETLLCLNLGGRSGSLGEIGAYDSSPISLSPLENQ